ncbi:hypothetical protein A3860_33845 [Niastella vici]|uniref:Uncharacterized protein n=1 Tax=Niastella vici TaxID=1703345 RepID=A0A1V9FPS4_9BACT|nr:hypothetical protein [Niastella vici]OQP60365.1 hypothetical protein A3860_33845 [Niastella vici]
MQVYTEYFANEKALFKRVNTILKKNGIYDITGRKGQFTIAYTFSKNCRIAYTVLKGRDDKGFKLTIGGKETPRQVMYLKKGDILYLHYQRKKKACFYCPKALIGKREFRMEASIGYAWYGTLENMMEEGLIKNNLNCDISTYFSQLLNQDYGSICSR